MTRTHSSLLVLAILLVVMAAAGFAQTGPTVDQLIGLEPVGSPAISPDGRYVACTVREPNGDDNA